jgi:mannose-1-phosphate guanylyltransferase/mannose-1-phosphate guanylyltransferase/mannose-6-phosphate isomerase
MSHTRPIVPVLLSGGTGSRLWPLSREAYPKQLLPLVGDRTMLQQTAARVMDSARYKPLLVVGNTEHRFIIAEQLRGLGIKDATVVLEPEGRNTAPAAVVAALAALNVDPDAMILLMPADHVVQDVAAFQAAVETGAQAAEKGHFVLFGIRPTEPATGYGYIEIGDELGDAPGAHRVRSFVEKPKREVAEQYLASQRHLWNGGFFLLPAREFIAEVEQLAPDVLKGAGAAFGNAHRDLDFLRLDADAFGRCPSVSIDYAVMEKTGRAVVVPTSFGWTDVGSWSALWDIGTKDADGNVTAGDVILDTVKDSYVRSEGPLVAALGVENVIVIATNDAVLVIGKDRDQDVKRIVERLKAEGRDVATLAPQVHRPWGFYQSVHVGDRFQVKRITVKPGAKLSLQKHFHRAEHWVVVNGTALVTRDNEEILVRENESIFLPLGCVHRLENPGKVPLNLIEVQSGAYLGEDDIVRIEDIYARVERLS